MSFQTVEFQWDIVETAAAGGKQFKWSDNFLFFISRNIFDFILCSTVQSTAIFYDCWTTATYSWENPFKSIQKNCILNTKRMKFSFYWNCLLYTSAMIHQKHSEKMGLRHESGCVRDGGGGEIQIILFALFAHPYFPVDTLAQNNRQSPSHSIYVYCIPYTSLILLCPGDFARILRERQPLQ